MMVMGHYRFHTMGNCSLYYIHIFIVTEIFEKIQNYVQISTPHNLIAGWKKISYFWNLDIWNIIYKKKLFFILEVL